VIETYRRDNGVTDRVSAFGPEPKGGAAKACQRKAMERTERVQRQLREVSVRQRVRERSVERRVRDRALGRDRASYRARRHPRQGFDRRCRSRVHLSKLREPRKP